MNRPIQLLFTITALLTASCAGSPAKRITPRSPDAATVAVTEVQDPAPQGDVAAPAGGAVAAPVVQPVVRPVEPSDWIQRKDHRLRLYGFPRADAIFTDSRLAPNDQFPFFVVSEAPGSDTADDSEFEIHPRLTRLGVDVARDTIPTIPSSSLAGKIEFDFQNGGSESRQAVRLRHAYVQIADENGMTFLAGQTNDLISPLWPSANGDSLMWNAGNLGDRRPQMRLTHRSAVSDEGTLDLAFAIARFGAINNRDLNGDGTPDGIAAGIPMFQVRVGVDNVFDGAFSGGLWGHLAWEDIEVAGGVQQAQSSSVGIDVLLHLTDRLGIAGEGWYGEDLDDVRGGIAQGINSTTGEEIASRGGWAEFRYDVTERYRVALGYTIDNPVNGDLDPTETIGGGAREKNQTAFFANRFNFGAGLVAGFEYSYWNTDYLDVPGGDANRVNFWIIYKF